MCVYLYLPCIFYYTHLTFLIKPKFCRKTKWFNLRNKKLFYWVPLDAIGDKLSRRQFYAKTYKRVRKRTISTNFIPTRKEAAWPTMFLNINTKGLKIDNSWRESPRGNWCISRESSREWFIFKLILSTQRCYGLSSRRKGRKVEFLVPNLVHSSEPNWNWVPRWELEETVEL